MTYATFATGHLMIVMTRYQKSYISPTQVRYHKHKDSYGLEFLQPSLVSIYGALLLVVASGSLVTTTSNSRGSEEYVTMDGDDTHLLISYDELRNPVA
jgi:hypothetical protein